MLSFSAFFCALTSLASASGLALTTYPITDEGRFLFEGRYLRNTTTSVSFDTPLSQVRFRVSNATFVGLSVDAQNTGGSRLGVYYNTNMSVAAIADPTPSGLEVPNLRVATLVTSPHQTLYTLASGDMVKGVTVEYTVQLLSEWEMMGDKSPAQLLSLLSLTTDGAVLQAPPRRTRRLVILGDSLSSGVGCGGTTTNGACGAGVAQDDASATWGANLCSALGAECEILAASGITIAADPGYNLPLVFPWALGSMTSFAPQDRVKWGFPAADAVLLELGENDCHKFNCSLGSDVDKLVDAYDAFVRVVVEAYGGRLTLPVFLSIVNHEAGQSAAMLKVIPRLASEGYTRVSFLNATTPGSVNGTNIDNGCAGHPSAAQNVIAAGIAAPIVRKVLGW
jgi:hypothetical protein